MLTLLANRRAHAEVWHLAAPMILSNLTIPLLGLVDTAVMGHLSAPHYLGAVAVGGVIFSFIYWGFGFLRMGTTGLTAQAYGREDGDEIRAILGRAMVLAAVFACAVLLLQGVIHSIAFAVLEASDAVEAAAAQYFFIRVWSAPASLANYVLIGWFLGMQNARGPLYLLLMVNITNIVLDLFFVLVWQMDVAGVALASVVAEYLGMLLGVWLVRRELRRCTGQWRVPAMLAWDKLRQLVAVNVNILIRTLCLIFSFAFFTAQGAKHGDVVLAANAVLMNFQTFMAYGLDGFAHAAEALIGRAVGQRNAVAFRRAVYTAGLWSLLVAGVFVGVYGVGGVWVIDSLTDIESVRQTAYVYLPWLIVAPMLSVWSYLFDGIFIGATRSAQMRDTMLVSTVVFFLPAWYLLQPWGNHGLWAALMVFMVARGVTMAVSYTLMQRRGEFA